MPEESTTFDPCWAILELMGHRRIAGHVSEATIAGQSFIRIDVPDVPGQDAFTQFYGAGSLYCLTPTTEEIARAVAARSIVRPVERYELALPKPVMREEDYEDE
ncbi:MAG: acetyltransferase [Armatimonadota bacterium]